MKVRLVPPHRDYLADDDDDDDDGDGDGDGDGGDGSDDRKSVGRADLIS